MKKDVKKVGNKEKYIWVILKEDINKTSDKPMHLFCTSISDIKIGDYVGISCCGYVTKFNGHNLIGYAVKYCKNITARQNYNLFFKCRGIYLRRELDILERVGMFSLI